MILKAFVILEAFFLCAAPMYYSGNVWTDLAYDSNYGINRQQTPVITADHTHSDHQAQIESEQTDAS